MRPQVFALALWLAVPAATAWAQDDDDASLGAGAGFGLDAELDAEDGDAEAEAEADAYADGGDDDASLAEDDDDDDTPVDDDDADDDASDPLEDAGSADALSGGGGRAVRLRSAAGLGMGTLSYERPSASAVEVLPETGFGAADVLLGVQIWPQESFSLDVLLAYQTSVGLTLELTPLFALPERVDARYQRGELSVAPQLRLDEGPMAPMLAVPLGFVVQFFEPTVHQLSLERFTLGGPNARVELVLPLGERVALRAGPEAQWIVIINPSLADEGACCQGFAVGGQGSIEATVGPNFRAALAYRESHAFAPAGAWRFKSVERFLTARIVGEL